MKISRKTKEIIKKLLTRVYYLKSYCSQFLLEIVLGQLKKITYKSVDMEFGIPNEVCLWRVRTFSTKEPDTLNWIGEMSQDSIFWDIGANIGIYSIYAAKLKNCQVFAFEPSVFNLDQLARNISLNKVEKNIAICPIALNNKIGINTFKLSSLTMGGALSSFAHNVDANGDYLGAMLEYRTLGVTLDCLNQFFDIPKPNYIKIDVDGIEHLILSGGVNILREVNSVLVELPGVWQEQSRDAKRYLQDAGLRLVSSHSYDPDLNPNASANEIWAR